MRATQHIEQYLRDKLEERALNDNLRQLVTKRAPVDFFSNDYLGFVTDGIVAKQLQDTNTNTGSTGSRLLSGNNIAMEQLETSIASFHNAEAALLFNSGYDANIGLLACIANRHATILYDELCHASIIDGIRLSQSTQCYKFKHNDIDALKAKLERATGPTYIVVESIYSMDGDMAPLAEIAALAETYNAALIVDEAHATGIFGKHGAGLVCSLGLEEKVFARVHTFGKALGCHGAVVVGSNLLKQYLINFARSFIYTTALPGHTISSIKAAYDCLGNDVQPTQRLHTLIQYFNSNAKQSRISGWQNNDGPIQALIIGDATKAKNIAQTLQQAGMQVNAIMHPTVPKGAERLRICLHAFNTEAQIDKLMETLNAYEER